MVAFDFTTALSHNRTHECGRSLATMSHDIASLFTDFAAWKVFASGQAEGTLARLQAPDGTPGLRLDYDFHEGAGFVAIRRTTELIMPSTFGIGLLLRSQGPANALEFKVASPDGADVWRHLRPALAPGSDWIPVQIRERDLPFAWGPAGGGPPAAVGAVEFVVVAGPGGKGSVELAGLSFTDDTLKEPSSIRASSSRPGTSAAAVLASAPSSDWQSAPDDRHPCWEVEFGRPQRFGGLVIHWPSTLPPRDITVELADQNGRWSLLYRAARVQGLLTHIPAPGAEAHALRISFATAACAALHAVTLRPDAFTQSPNEFMHAVAADFPRGYFPRYWLREQSYWTTVGTPAGTRRALLNEEGLLETDEAGYSLEPFVLTPAGPVTWASVRTSIALPKGGAPFPSVTWRADSFQLEILPWVDGHGEDLALHVTYRLTRDHPGPGFQLIVAVRPFQVDPPWQAFRHLGGRSPLHQIQCSRTGVAIAGRTLVVDPPATAAGAAAFEEGEAPSVLTTGAVPSRRQIDDPSGLASAELAWALPAGHATFEVTVSLPYTGPLVRPGPTARPQALARWRRVLGRVKWQVPPCAEAAFDTFRTAAGHILINRDRLALQPGPRRYTRSWIRDGVIMGVALAKAGLPRILRDYLGWYAPFVRDDGFVPCVVDHDGVDLFVEHDSHGQFLWALREVVRTRPDPAYLARMQPVIRRAAEYLITLRAQRMTAPYREKRRLACYGLLPESASHEGYLAHPVHSYWDDFWGVRGLEAAAELAGEAGLTGEALRWKREASRFQADLLRSMRRVIADRGLTTLPGSVEWADFDPTATSNAIAMLDFADALPRKPLQAMLETYLEGFHRKHEGRMPWNNYTAYEIRIIGAFVRLGQRDTANELLTFFLADRRPREWNQWPEISWRNPRAPGHLGDVPHTWIAAEYLLALASMVAVEREDRDALVLASGMPWEWISGARPFAVKGLPTRYGALDFSLHATEGATLHVRIGGRLRQPPGGVRLLPPFETSAQTIVAVETKRAGAARILRGGKEVVVNQLPFRATLRLGPAGAVNRARSRAG